MHSNPAEVTARLALLTELATALMTALAAQDASRVTSGGTPLRMTKLVRTGMLLADVDVKEAKKDLAACLAVLTAPAPVAMTECADCGALDHHHQGCGWCHN